MAQIGGNLPYGAGHATGPVMPVIDAAYCVPGQVVLKAKEKTMSLTGDDFSITGEDGTVWFKVDAKLLSMREKRVLVDGAGRPVAALQKKLISLKPAWQLFRGADFQQPVATIKQKLLTLKPSVGVFLEGQEEAAFKCKGNFLAKKFEVLAVTGGQETAIAKIGKESRFSSAGAFAKAMLTDSHTYFIEAQPGTDLAFLAALCIAVDELFRDQEKK